MPCGPDGPGGPIGPGIPSRPGGPGGPAPRLYQFRFIFVPFANYEIGFCSNKRMSMYVLTSEATINRSSIASLSSNRDN